MSAYSNDFEMMQAITERDGEALRQLYGAYRSRVYSICLRIVRDTHDAEEVLLDVFHELWQKPERYQSARSAPHTYILMLARSRAIDRARQVRGRANAVDIDFVPEAAMTTPVEQSEVEIALGELKPSQRELIELSVFSGRSHSQIAAELELPLGTVKTRIREGLHRLRRALRASREVITELPGHAE